MLYAEKEIRHAIKEKRQEISFYPTGDRDGGIKSHVSDRTGNTALKLSKELQAVYVDGVGTVPRPETWMKCFDAVRSKAGTLARPQLIFDTWRIRYEEKGIFLGEKITGELDSRLDPDCFIMWIIYHVEKEAFMRGLLMVEQCSLYCPEEEGKLKTEKLKTGEPENV